MNSKSNVAVLGAIVASEKQHVKSNIELLRDVSQKDATWDEHRSWADKVSSALDEAGMPLSSARVRDCATSLFFGHKLDMSTGELKLKLRNAPFCHYRHCSICAWRRSLKHKAILMRALKPILEEYSTARFVMLTLTVRNCELSELRDGISQMNKSWNRLLKRKDWPALGWIRAVEVTRGDDGSAHPHFHCMLMLPASYFDGKNYVKKSEWAKRWQECLRVDYEPVCDIRIIKPRLKKSDDDVTSNEIDSKIDAMRGGIAEVVKYATKSSDLLAGGKDWLLGYINQVANLKFLTSGGILKGIFKSQKDDEKEDLIHVGGGEDDDTMSGKALRFDWRKMQKHYARKVQL